MESVLESKETKEKVEKLKEAYGKVFGKLSIKLISGPNGEELPDPKWVMDMLLLLHERVFLLDFGNIIANAFLRSIATTEVFLDDAIKKSVQKTFSEFLDQAIQGLLELADKKESKILIPGQDKLSTGPRYAGGLY